MEKHSDSPVMSAAHDLTAPTWSGLQANLSTVDPQPLTWAERRCRETIASFFSRLEVGQLELWSPDGEYRTFGPGVRGPIHCMVVHHPRFFTRCLLHGNLGLGEAYMDGDWTCDDLSGVLSLLATVDRTTSHREVLRWSRASNTLSRLAHLVRANTRRGSRRNIRAHYDLGNEFFQTFLDESMQYSSARFHRMDECLEVAQQQKMDAMIAKSDLQPSDHVLEIGCGWGGFAIRAASTIGCRVTGITISDQQYELARQRVVEAGVEDRVSIQRCDYRDVAGSYDKIVSIEMLEAVGHAYLGTFFHACDRVLRAGGRAALQVITIPDQRYEMYRHGTDWIQKHIFPGGLVPSLTAMANAMTRHSRLVVDHLEGMGLSYAATLRSWRHRFGEQTDSLRGMGFDEAFIRKWTYYFAYCEAGFATRYLDVLQMVLRRPGPQG